MRTGRGPTWSAMRCLNSAPPHMMGAIALMMFTGLGPKDALRLPRTFYRDGAIATRRSKTAEPVFWPAPALLGEILSKAPAHNALTLCANSRVSRGPKAASEPPGAPCANDLSSISSELDPASPCTASGIPWLSFLREAGADERTIADALGQKTIEMARHYARGADPQGEDAGSCGKL